MPFDRIEFKMQVIAFKGISQVGKSQVAQGIVYGADLEDQYVSQIEFSDALVHMANQALRHQPASPEQLERLLLHSMRLAIDFDLPDRLPPRNFDDDEIGQVQRDILRRDFLDWSRTIPPAFELTPENKDANRIILTWLAIFGRHAARDNAVFARPVLRRLEADEHVGRAFAVVGGLRFPDELTALGKKHKVSVVEVMSARRPMDHDLANLRRDEITADTVYYANFDYPEDSFRYAASVLWPDIKDGRLKPSYGTP